MKNLISKLVSKFNSDDAIQFSEKDLFKENQSWAITGSPELEFNLGILGFPTGIIEISGVSRSGKTTLGLEAINNFLRTNEDGIAIILSSENRDNKEYAKNIGIDTERVMILKIRYVEDMFMKIKKIINNTKEIYEENKIKEKPKFLFLWDSLGATLSKAELDTMEENISSMEKKMDKGEQLENLKHEKMGAFAKSAKMFAKYITGEMYDNIIHFLILNHVYDQMGVMTQGKKSGGGNWIEYMPCIRLRMTLIKTEKIDDMEVAQYSEIKVVKNDFGSRKKTVVEILLGKGFVLSQSDIDFAVKKGILKKEGVNKRTFMNISWSSKRTFYEQYEKNPKIMKILHKKIHASRHKQILKNREDI